MKINNKNQNYKLIANFNKQQKKYKNFRNNFLLNILKVKIKNKLFKYKKLKII